jgi:hypothetical protein
VVAMAEEAMVVFMAAMAVVTEEVVTAADSADEDMAAMAVTAMAADIIQDTMDGHGITVMATTITTPITDIAETVGLTMVIMAIDTVQDMATVGGVDVVCMEEDGKKRSIG